MKSSEHNYIKFEYNKNIDKISRRGGWLCQNYISADKWGLSISEV